VDQAEAFDFVFDGAVTRRDWDEADHEERLQMVEAHVGLGGPDEADDDGRFTGLLRLAVVEQIVSGRPPEAWAAAQRLAAGGMGHDEIVGQLTIVLVHALRANLDGAGSTADTPPAGMEVALRPGAAADVDDPDADGLPGEPTAIDLTVDLPNRPVRPTVLDAPLPPDRPDPAGGEDDGDDGRPGLHGPTLDLRDGAGSGATDGSGPTLDLRQGTGSPDGPKDPAGADDDEDDEIPSARSDPQATPPVDVPGGAGSSGGPDQPEEPDPSPTPDPSGRTDLPGLPDPLGPPAGSDPLDRPGAGATDPSDPTGGGQRGDAGGGAATPMVVPSSVVADARYVGWLAELPLPGSDAAAEALQELASAAKVLPTDELIATTAEKLGYSRGNQPVVRYVERIEEALAGLTDEGPLAWLPGGRTAHVAALTDAITLTHRLGEDERRSGALAVSFDLAGFARIDAPVHDGVELTVHRDGSPVSGGSGAPADAAVALPSTTSSGEVVWVGPPGWLDRFAPDTVLAVHLTGGAPLAETTADPTGDRPGPTTADRATDRSDRVAETAGADQARRPPADADDEPATTGGPGKGSGSDDRPARRRVVHLEALPDAPAVDPSLVAALRRVYDEDVAEPGLPASAEGLVLGVLAADPGAFDGPRAPLGDLVDAARLERRGTDVAHDPAVWAQARALVHMNDVVDRTDDRRVSRAAVEVLTDAAHVAEGVPVDLARLRSSLNHLRDDEVLGLVTDQVFDVGASAGEADRFAAELLDAAHGSPQVSTARYVAALAAERVGEVAVAEQQLELAVEADAHNLAAVDRLGWYASDRGDAARAVGLWRRCEAAGEVVVDMRTVEPFTQAAAASAGGRNDPCWCGSGRKNKHCHLGVLPQPPLPDRVPWLCQKAVDYVRRSRQGRNDLVSVAFALTVSGDDVRQALADPLSMDLVLVEGGWFHRFLSARVELLPDDEAELAAEWLTVPRSVHEVVAVRVGEGLVLRDLRTGDEVDVRERTFTRHARVGTHWCARVVPDGETHQIVGGVFPLDGSSVEEDLLPLLDAGDPYGIAEWRATEEERTRREAEEDGEAGPPPTAEDMSRIRDQLEERWCDEPHPDLDGQTPRQAAADPTQAERLERLLATIDAEAAPPPMDVLNKRTPRLRRLLGL
jgi:SEC-C motif-containing protein